MKNREEKCYKSSTVRKCYIMNTIGSFARHIIATRNELSNQDILEIVKNQFPDAKTSIACIAWYKSDMKKKGYKTEVKEVERTLDVIQNELEAAKAKVEELTLELEIMTQENQEKLEAEYERLKTLLGK